MENVPWAEEFPGDVTVCDLDGKILSMNRSAATSYAKYGGLNLVGSNLLDCHPEPSRTKLVAMLRSGELNVYTIEKGGVRKLVYQAPWYENGVRCGHVELALVMPDAIPHFHRDAG